MSIEIRQLRYAVLTADTQSFSRAAAALRVKQSTLSRRVMQLEHRLGIKLFDRSTRGAEVTVNGKAFIEQARRILTDADNLVTTAHAVSYGEQGRLAIGYSSSLMSGPLKFAFADYLTRYPDVQFDGIEAGSEKLISGLQSRSIDVVVAPTGMEEAGVRTRPLGCGLAFEHDRTAIGEDQPVPGEQHAVLSKLNIGFIVANQPRALRDEQDAPGRAVIDILGDLRRDQARQVRTDAGNQRGGNDRSGQQDVGRGQPGEPFGRDSAPVAGAL